MLTKTLITTAFVLSVSGAFADGVSPGAAMLAQIAGVEPGAYTVADIIRLEDAREETVQAAEVQYILKSVGVARSAPWTPAEPSGGTNQLADALGATRGAHSIAEMIIMSDAAEENDTRAYALYASGANRESMNDDVGRVTPAKAQMAAALGVDPAAFSLSELVVLQADELN